ncbi:hypothetical protein UlMin_003294 [Ulmus minor]
MSRFIVSRNGRRVAESLLPIRISSGLELRSKGVYDRVSTVNSLSRLFLCHKSSMREHSPFTLYKANKNLLKTGSFHGISASNTISHHAQIAWKRLSQLCSYGGPALPCIGQIACAVSLALTRSNLVAPGVIAFVVGEGALYLNAQDGHVYLTSFVFSLLECFILFLIAVYLAILFAPCIPIAPFAESFGTLFMKTWLHLVHRQWAATRPDLFARDLCNELAKLHTKAPAHSFSFTRKSIERAFGRKLPEIFETFEEEPVASGSVAQVHQATLKYRYPGQQIKPVVVAVKILQLLNCVGKISRFIPALNWLRLDESIQQFAVFMMSQVDLSREAAHLSRFIYNFRSWKDVSFPRPLYHLVHPSVLVETYEQGESVLHYVDELEGNEKIKSVLAHIGTHALLKMLLVDNFIHADMHPGNILVRVTNNKLSSERFFKSRPHVIFLHVDMTAELSKRDGRTAAESMLRLSKQQNCPNPSAFVEVMQCYPTYFLVYYCFSIENLHYEEMREQDSTNS